MRILFVTQVDLDVPHGGTRHVVGLSKALAARGIEVDLIAPGGGPIEGVRRIRVPTNLKPGMRMEAALAGLCAWTLARRRPDIVYIRVSASSSAVAFACARFGVPYVVELNGNILEELEERGRRGLQLVVVKSNLRRVFAGARHTVAMFAGIAEHARQRLGAQDVLVASHGVDLDVAQLGDRKQSRERLGLPADKPLIALVSTLGSELRLDLLAQALSGVDATLVVAGSGERQAQVEEMVASGADVRYLGSLPHAQAIDVLRAADVCVNVRAGFVGMKGLEYAAMGRRQVGFEHPDLARLKALYPDQLGFVAVDETAGALQQGLLDALKAERERGPLSAESVQLARKELGWGVKAGELAALFDSLV